MILTLTSFVFSGIEIKNGSPNPVPTFGMVIFAPFVIFFSLAAIFILLKRLMKSQGVERQQLSFILLGILTMLGLIISTILIPVALFKIILFVPLAPIYTLIFLGCTTYAILKHRLLDIRLVVARSIAYSMLVIAIALIYTSAVFGISIIFFKGEVNRSLTIIYAILAMFVAFTFNPLRQVIEKLTDKALFKNNYDSSELLSSLTKVMATTLQLEDLTKTTLHKLLETVHISKGAFLIFEGANFYPPITEGFEQNFEFNKSLMEWLASFKKVLIFDEEANPRIKMILRQLNFSVVLPLIVGEDIHGLLVLGEKKSGEIYSSQDIKMLEIFGPEVSVAVQNSKAFEEIKKFNVTLKEEINKATQELQVANKSLEELDKVKDDFVSVASHELRTPMTAIRSYVWMALNRPDIPLSEKLKKNICLEL